MRRGTTPTFSFRVDADLTDWDIYITFEQKRHLFTKKDVTIAPENGGSKISLTLTQEETLAFKPGPAKAQIRAVKDGVAVASAYFDFIVSDILLDGVIPREV